MAGPTATSRTMPAIAHPRAVIEPHLDDGQRDEGEERLRPLRAVLRLLAAPARGGNGPSWTTRRRVARRGARRAPGEPTAAVRFFLGPTPRGSPRSVLCTSWPSFTTATCWTSTWTRRIAWRACPCAASRWWRCRTRPTRRRPRWSRGCSGAGSRARRPAAPPPRPGTLTLTRVDRGAVEVTVRSDKGQRRAPVVVKLPIVLLDRLFARAPPSARARATAQGGARAERRVCGRRGAVLADADARMCARGARARGLRAQLGIEVITLHTMGGHKRRTALRELAPAPRICAARRAAQPKRALRLDRRQARALHVQPRTAGAGCASGAVPHARRGDAAGARAAYNCCGFGLQAAVACVHKMADGKSRSAVYHTFSLHQAERAARARRSSSRDALLAAASSWARMRRTSCAARDEELHELAVGMDAVHRAGGRHRAGGDRGGWPTRHGATDLLRASQSTVFPHTNPTATARSRAGGDGRTVALPAKEATCAPTLPLVPEAPRAPRRAR